MKTKILSETFMLEARGLQKTTCLTFRGEGRTVSPVTALFGCTAAAQSQAAGRLAVDFQTAACVSLQTSSPECRTPNVSRATRLRGGDSRVASRQRSRAVGSVGCSRQTDLPEVCHRIHSTSSSRLNFQICLYSRVARSQSSGPAAVTETSHGGAWSLEIAEECDLQNKQLPVKYPHSVCNESGIKSGKMFVAALANRRSWEDIRLANYTFA